MLNIYIYVYNAVRHNLKQKFNFGDSINRKRGRRKGEERREERERKEREIERERKGG